MDPHVVFHAIPSENIDHKIEATHGDDDAYTQVVVPRVDIDTIGASH